MGRGEATLVVPSSQGDTSLQITVGCGRAPTTQEDLVDVFGPEDAGHNIVRGHQLCTLNLR
jgi:hypothetical protein